MQLACGVDQERIHGAVALFTTALVQQSFDLGIFGIGLGITDRFLAWHQVDGLLAGILVLGRGVTTAAQKRACGGHADQHWALASRTANVGGSGLVAQHFFLGPGQLLAKAGVKLVEDLFEGFLSVGHRIQLPFHIGGEFVIHQIIEARDQTIRDNFTHLVGEEASVLDTHISLVLDRADNRRIGRWPSDTTLF